MCIDTVDAGPLSLAVLEVDLITVLVTVYAQNTAPTLTLQTEFQNALCKIVTRWSDEERRCKLGAAFVETVSMECVFKKEGTAPKPSFESYKITHAALARACQSTFVHGLVPGVKDAPVPVDNEMEIQCTFCTPLAQKLLLDNGVLDQFLIGIYGGDVPRSDAAFVYTFMSCVSEQTVVSLVNSQQPKYLCVALDEIMGTLVQIAEACHNLTSDGGQEFQRRMLTILCGEIGEKMRIALVSTPRFNAFWPDFTCMETATADDIKEYYRGWLFARVALWGGGGPTRYCQLHRR